MINQTMVKDKILRIQDDLSHLKKFKAYSFEEVFYNTIGDCLEDYTRYCRYILEYLAKQ